MIDFSNVKSIVIPEGEVVVIARGDEILWKKQTSRLPAEYQEVTYLEGAGAQYIDTGITPDDTCGYKVDVEQIDASSEQCPIGCMVSGNRFVGTYFLSKTSANRLTVGWGSRVAPINYSFEVNQRVISSCNYLNDRKAVFNGSEIHDLTGIHINGTINQAVFLFRRNYSNAAPFKGRIYSAVISKGNEIIADFVPCYRKSDGKTGMYDLISKTFSGNVGTGEFICGAERAGG